MKTYLVELLMKQDQMSMAASIESRVPFLDHHLVEFAAGLPDDRKLTGWSTKRILREACRRHPPPPHSRPPEDGLPCALCPVAPRWLGRRRKGGLARFPRPSSAASSNHRRSRGCCRFPVPDDAGCRRRVGTPESRAAGTGRSSTEKAFRRCRRRRPLRGMPPSMRRPPSVCRTRKPCAFSGSTPIFCCRSTREASCAPGT